jgi:hypothetical protein
MKTLTTLALASVLALGTTAAFAQSNSNNTSGNTSMTAPATPSTGKVNPTGDQKQVDPMAKGKPAMDKSAGKKMDSTVGAGSSDPATKGKADANAKQKIQ